MLSFCSRWSYKRIHFSFNSFHTKFKQCELRTLLVPFVLLMLSQIIQLYIIRHQKATHPKICQNRFGTDDLVLCDISRTLFLHIPQLLRQTHSLLSVVPHYHRPLRWYQSALFSIQHIATNCIFSQYTCGPLAELSSTNRIHTITNTDNRIEVIKLERAIYISVTFTSSYRNFLGSCLFFQFARIIDVLQMNTYIVRGTVEQHTHHLLGTPHRFILIVHLYALFLPLNLKDQELSRTVPYFSAFCHISFEKLINNFVILLKTI